MLNYNSAVKLLSLCNIPNDIQKKILLLFIGFGTPESHMIKTKMNLLNKKVAALNVKLAHNDHAKTLWRYKITMEPPKNARAVKGSLASLKNHNFMGELRIAYLLNGNNDDYQRIDYITEITKDIQTRRKTELSLMFYGVDKYYWKKPIGTQSSIIIHNAINAGIIKTF